MSSDLSRDDLSHESEPPAFPAFPVNAADPSGMADLSTPPAAPLPRIEPVLPDTPAQIADRLQRLERRLLGGPRVAKRRDVAKAAGVSLLSARKLWRALGFASVPDEDVVFTEADQEALTRVVTLVRRGLLDEETAIACARALGQTTDRLVSWQTEALAEYLARTPMKDVDGLVAHVDAGGRVEELLDDLEWLLVYSWRRQVAATLDRMSVAGGASSNASSAEITVGFADLVSYTQLSRRLSQRELGTLVQRFEGFASDIVTAGGGRVVKTVGDEVLFTTDEPHAAAVIALSIAELMSGDAVVPDVRIGLAHGPVLRSLGDVYGPTVNLASRLTALAQPGTVVTDPPTARVLGEREDLVLVPQRRRQVRGFGLIQPLLLTRIGPESGLISLD